MKTKIKKFGKFEPKTNEQIDAISNSKAFEGQNIAVMPDAHYGKGACVGFTATFTDKIIPNVVGVDVGCGMTITPLPSSFTKSIEDLQKLQNAIRTKIPYGMKAHKTPIKEVKIDEEFFNSFSFEFNDRQKDRIEKSLGSLGGGNHFIEVDEGEDGKLYLVIHSGSRSLGTTVAKHHQDIAVTNFVKRKPTKEEIMKKEPWERADFIKHFGKPKVDDKPQKDLEYLVGDQVKDYLNDMEITQMYAKFNREAMTSILLKEIIPSYDEYLDAVSEMKHTVHNYVDIENKIIRKGSIFADEENDVIIPLNMRDGSIIARGVGNKEANFSAPHGAGRVMSRTVAKNTIELKDFKETMEGITSWTVNENTLDEAPFAYKTKKFILENLKGLVKIKEIIKPVFNFKDDSESINYGKKRKRAK